MKIRKLTLVLLAVTVTSFGLSFVAAQMAGLNSQTLLPFRLAQQYTSQAQGQTGRIHRDIDAPGVTEIRIETAATDIEVVPSEDAAVRVDVEGIFLTGRTELDDALQVNIEGKTLVLGLDEEFAKRAGPRLRLEFGPKRLVIKVPATVQKLNLQSSSGDIEVRELILMSVQAQAASGEIGLREATVQSSRLQAASGDLTIQGTFEEIEAATHSGDLHVDLQNSSPKGKLTSSSGDLRLNFRQAPQVTLKYETNSGEIQVEDGLKALLTGSKQQGATELRATTASGDISITSQ